MEHVHGGLPARRCRFGSVAFLATTLSLKPTQKGRAAFAAAADAILPRTAIDGAWDESATELGIPDRLDEFYELLPDDKARKDLNQLLGLMSSAIGGLMLYGRAKKFVDLSPDARAAALTKMMKSRLVMKRQGAKVLKLVTGFLAANPPHGTASWPVWEVIGYPGPQGPPPPEPKRLRPVEITGPAEWSVDVVVVGSGAGGGPAAAVLAAAGLEVVVLEKGGYRNEADFSHYELNTYREMYLDSGAGSTVDSGFGMLAGSTLGGGTVVNYSTSFATPDPLREQWDEEAGFDDVFTGAEYSESSRAVQRSARHQHKQQRAVEPRTAHGEGPPRPWLARRRHATQRRELRPGGVRLLRAGVQVGVEAVDAPHLARGRRRSRSPDRSERRRAASDDGRKPSHGHRGRGQRDIVGCQGNGRRARSRRSQHAGHPAAQRCRDPGCRQISPVAPGDRTMGPVRGAGVPVDRHHAGCVLR